MKTFIDRMAYAGHRPRFYEQNALYVVTSAGPGGMKECLAAMQGPISHFGFRTAGCLGLMTPPFKVPQKYADKNERKIADASRKLYDAIKSQGPASPTLTDVIGFRSIQAMGNELGGMYGEIYPADSAYWKEKGWMDRSQYYYTDAKISPVKKALARIAVATIMIYLKRTLFAEAGKNPAMGAAGLCRTAAGQTKGE
jgi:hypothetical protein